MRFIVSNFIYDMCHDFLGQNRDAVDCFYPFIHLLIVIDVGCIFEMSGGSEHMFPTNSAFGQKKKMIKNFFSLKL